ncbi:MAG: hypothetical protein R6X22_12850 [Gemmatimonadota bacterium]|jgi:hypothetical protein
MWYDTPRTGIEALKAVLSVAVLWGGTVVSGTADRATFVPPVLGAAEDVVGVWSWAVDSSLRPQECGPSETRLLEFRRGEGGRLVARALVHDGRRSVIEEIADVSFEEGRLRLTMASGVAFLGTMRGDGRSIDGVVRRDGTASASLLRRVETRRHSREPSPLRAT